MRVIFSLILTLCMCTSLAQTSERIDSLEGVLNGEPPPVDTVKVTILNKLCAAYMGNDQDKAIDYGKAALELATAISDYEGMASSLNTLGTIYDDLGSYDKALDNYQRSILIYRQLGDKLGMARVYSNIGVNYGMQADYESALKNYIKSLKLKEEILAKGEDNSIKQGVANTLNNIGLIYWQQGKLDKALAEHEKALKINIELRTAGPTNLINKRETAQTYNNIGTIYFYKEEYKDAIGYFIMAKLIREEIGDKRLIAQSINNIGGVYFYLENYEKATESFYKAYQILKEVDDKKGMIGCLLNIGEIYSIKEYYDKAIDYTNQALAIAREIGSKNDVKRAYQNLAVLYAHDNSYPEAYAYHQKYTAIKDSILNEKSEQAQSRLTTIYETEKKERELELISKDNALKEAELGKQNTIIWSGALGLLLVAALAFFIYTGYRQKHKANALLKEQNDEITRQKEELAKLSLVAEKTDSGVVIADREGKIEWINDGFVRMIGYDYQEFIDHFGGSLSEISSNPDIEKVLEEIIREKKSYSHDSSYITKNGELMWTSSTITPVFEEGGELNKIVTVYNDITELKIAEEQIREKNEEITDSIRYAEGIQAAMMPR
ncbi:MAG TPA: tetratricopeptide repeat protein, partial [Flavobacteriales bacterium]|nr:tetratricopeptide repeat protein [Flavobacteriales bacterium]